MIMYSLFQFYIIKKKSGLNLNFGSYNFFFYRFQRIFCFKLHIPLIDMLYDVTLLLFYHMAIHYHIINYISFYFIIF